MDKIRLIHDQEGRTLTVWFDDPEKESLCEETSDEVVLMKDSAGKVIGFELLHYDRATPTGRIEVETVVHADA